jgi:hypothetical protein
VPPANSRKRSKPVLDFSIGDAQMKMAREAGFTMPVITYTAFNGLDLYHQSTKQTAAMKGFREDAQIIVRSFKERLQRLAHTKKGSTRAQAVAERRTHGSRPRKHSVFKGNDVA